MLNVLNETNSRLRQSLPCVFCAVVETRGSTPQKAGAAMLVFPDGSQHGTLGGGCVEAEVKQPSLAALHAGGAAEVLTFSLDDNYGWDDGLICGGRMTMLMAPLDPSAQAAAQAYYGRYQDLVASGQGCTEAVVVKGDIGAPVGSRYHFDSSGPLAAQIGPAEIGGPIAKHLTPLIDRPGPMTKQGVAFLPTLPRITLLIVGGGHVGKAVADLAATVDFEIMIVDDREPYASANRFPMARERFVGEIGSTLAEIKQSRINRSTYCLIVTRGHGHDEEALYHLADCPAASVGMIGSKRKIKLIFEDLIAKGVVPGLLERVHAPLGFDIGSQTVGEIAISIVAELIACRNLGSTSIVARQLIQGREPGIVIHGSPAGGLEKASRMGRSKLALPVGSSTVLERLVGTLLRRCEIRNILVVPAPEEEHLAALALRAGAKAVRLPKPTNEMRATVAFGLRWLLERGEAVENDSWLLIPADHPALTAASLYQNCSPRRSNSQVIRS